MKHTSCLRPTQEDFWVFKQKDFVYVIQNIGDIDIGLKRH